MTSLFHFPFRQQLPHKNEMAVIETTLGGLMLWAAIGAGSLLLAAAPDSMMNGFTEDQRLICICIAGGIGGGFLSIIIFPRTTLRGNAVKWLVSPITAGMFAPAICMYHKIETSIWYSLAASGAVGMFAWGVLFVVLPLGPVVARALVKRWFPTAFAQDEIPKRPDWIAKDDDERKP